MLTSTTVTHRLSPDAYAQLEKLAQPLIVQATTTELQVAFVLGQQAILKLVRDGFTHG